MDENEVLFSKLTTTRSDSKAPLQQHSVIHALRQCFFIMRVHTPKLDVSPKNKDIFDFSLDVSVTWLITLLNYATK